MERYLFKHFGNEENLNIGNYCSIGPKVTFMLSGEHNYKNISTYPFKNKYFNIVESKSKGPINIMDDVWIGFGVTILSGVTIGQGAVIGAGSVVTQDIPPYAIFANNKIIKYRFEEDVIKELLKIDYKKIDKNFIEKHIDDFYSECDLNLLKKFKELEKDDEQ